MKKFILLTLIVFGTIVFNPIRAQGPPPPPPELPGSGQMNGGKGQGGNKGPGEGPGAPIGGGLEILLLLGAAYGFNKWRKSPATTLE